MKVSRPLLFMASVTVAFGFWIFSDPGPIPLFDATLTRLVETEAEAYCVGQVYKENRPRVKQMKSCLEESTLSIEVDYTIVQRVTCKGFWDRDGAATVDQLISCTAFLQSNKLWPTVDAKLTREWDDNYPYPGDLMLLNSPEDLGDRSSGDDRADEEYRIPYNTER